MDAVFPAASIILGTAPLLVVWRFVKPRLTFFVVGAALLIVTLVIQPLPARLAVGALLPISAIAASVAAGAVAGFLQEGLKALPLKGAGPPEGAWLGAGFGVGEAALVALTQLISPSSPPQWVAVIPGVERLLSTWFHIVTAALLGAGWASGRFPQYFALAVLAHAGTDAAAAYVSLANLNPIQPSVFIPLYSGIACADLALTAVLTRSRPGDLRVR